MASIAQIQYHKHLSRLDVVVPRGTLPRTEFKAKRVQDLRAKG